MPKIKLQAGAELDVLSKNELKSVMDTVRQDWFNQVARGDRYPRFAAQGTIASQTLSIGGAEQADQRLGPPEGFVWAVQRLAVAGLTTITGTPAVATTEPVALYVNDSGASSLVHPAITGYADFADYELVLYPGDTLLVTGASLTSTGTVTVTGQARELPISMLWRLGG